MISPSFKSLRHLPRMQPPLTPAMKDEIGIQIPSESTSVEREEKARMLPMLSKKSTAKSERRRVSGEKGNEFMVSSSSVSSLQPRTWVNARLVAVWWKDLPEDGGLWLSLRLFKLWKAFFVRTWFWSSDAKTQKLEWYPWILKRICWTKSKRNCSRGPNWAGPTAFTATVASYCCWWALAAERWAVVWFPKRLKLVKTRSCSTTSNRYSTYYEKQMLDNGRPKLTRQDKGFVSESIRLQRTRSRAAGHILERMLFFAQLL